MFPEKPIQKLAAFVGGEIREENQRDKSIAYKRAHVAKKRIDPKSRIVIHIKNPLFNVI